VSALGAGGMGEVYRARDTRLGREVAVKILPAELADDPERRERFEREARIIAALNHPNILALYDSGSDQGITYLVTEVVEGHSLRNAQLTRRTALDVAAQIADGLAAAHAAGITHRDLKPDNIIVTRDGRAKILDFGVAKMTGQGGVAAATVASTGIGVIVGTLGYMAPEQIRGTAVDYRADIFAFGIVLHEMLSGARPFGGETAADVIGAILSKDPPELPADVPAGVRQVVHRCLEKKPEARFQSANDLAFALRQLSGSSIGAAAEPTRLRARPWPRMAIGAGIAASVVVLGAVLVVRWLTQTFDAAIDPLQLTRVSSDPLRETGAAFSPDGRSIAYVRISGGANELLVRSQDAFSPLELVRTPLAITSPIWAPDGNRICYSSVNRDFMCVGAAGGTPQRMLTDAFRPKFTPDGLALVFVRAADGGPRLFRSEPPGAEPRRVGDVPGDAADLSSISPDGSAMLAFGASGRWLISMATGVRRELPMDEGVETISAAWFPDSRHLAVTEITNNPIGFRILIIDSKSRARRLIVRSADPIEKVDVSGDGTRIVYSSGAADIDVAEYSIGGKFVRAAAASANVEMFPSWAPAGDRLVYMAGGPGQSDVLWMASATGGTTTVVQKLASPDRTSYRFSPDGRRIVYSDRTGLQIVAATGGQAIRVLASSEIGPYVCWSADGEWLWYSARRRLNKLPSQGGEPVAIPAPPFGLHDCSPDGRWVVGRGPKGFLVLSTDGTQQHDIATNADYPSDNVAQFGEGGRVLYMLNQSRRAIDVLEVPGGARIRSIAFDVSAGDMIQGFSIDASGTRVLLTLGSLRQDLWMAEGFVRPATSWRRWFRHWEAPS
jgi:Tol biopolymer transport system component/predicted Ser/Thr protein kinase